jgi:hypothetical protein
VKLGMQTIVKGGQKGAEAPDSLTMESIALSRFSLGRTEQSETAATLPLDHLPWASPHVRQASGQFRSDGVGAPP